LQGINSNLVDTQQQISTGKKVNKPSDDPVAAARILKLDQELKRVDTYERNANLADNRLKQEESALASSVDIIQRVRELTVQAGSGSLSPNDRQSISSELKERLGQLANITNSRDASGEYIFSGFQGSSQAFARDGQGDWVYQGDEGQRKLEIDDGVTVPISDHGKGIFVDVPRSVSVENSASTNGYISGLEVVDQDALRAASPPDSPRKSIYLGVQAGEVIEVDASGTPVTPAVTFGNIDEEIDVYGMKMTVNGAEDGSRFEVGINREQSVFGTIENLIDGLEGIAKGSDRGNAEYDALIAESLTNLDNAQEKIILKQTELGGRLNAVESTTAFLEDSGLYTKEIRSQLQDVDYAEAISNLSFQSFVLQAAQQSFAQVSRLSLFDRL